MQEKLKGTRPEWPANIFYYLAMPEGTLDKAEEVGTFLREVEVRMGEAEEMQGPGLEAFISLARTALQDAQNALDMTTREGTHQEAPPDTVGERVFMKLGRVTPEAVRFSFNVHTLEGEEGRLAAVLAFALGRGNYHSGLISVRQGGHYIGCGEGQPEADHIVVGCFDQDARTLTGFLEIHGPDLSITRSFGVLKMP